MPNVFFKKPQQIILEQIRVLKIPIQLEPNTQNSNRIEIPLSKS